MTSLGRKTLYDMLGVSPHASRQEIKTQFYNLSMLYHPDTSTSTDASTDSSARQHERFIQISHAYSILSNDLRRRIYDREHNLVAVKRERQWRPHPGARHSTTERPVWTRNPREFATNETVRRWTRWAEESNTERDARTKERVRSEMDQKHESATVQRRLIALLVSVTVYWFLNNNTRQ
ncbi:hypothetical protein PSACC_00831 [Paramicrosporidium saccamoebae]|uniref:J domain-containing protein n=1 Tax=Paramicrosporidium saccamoebae TaxID=1246581 RepID=A0A2H9TNM2_9FUNG|nr:hypothetical protein PSACC_00831 [Paramicrosporidium saccamoebae]